MKLVLRDEQELDDTITYIRAFQSFLHLPELRVRPTEPVDAALIPVDVATGESRSRNGGRCLTASRWIYMSSSRIASALAE